MNLKQIRELCQFRSGYNDAAFNPQWNAWINEAIREFSRRQPWDGLEDLVDLTTDGTEYLVLPPYVGDVISLLNTTIHRPVDRDGDWDRESPSTYSQRTTGSVFSYDKIGTVAALRAPTGYLVLAGTNSSDVGAIYVTGHVANSGASGTALANTIASLSFNATGTSPQTLSTLFNLIVSISKATDTNGDFFFYDAGASLAHISFLGHDETSAEFRRLQLMFKPAAQTTFRLKFRHKIPPLRNDAQAPPPAVKDDFVVAHSLSLFYANREQFTKAQSQAGDATRILQDEAARETNFNEPYSQIIPFRADDDPDYPIYPLN